MVAKPDRTIKIRAFLGGSLVRSPVPAFGLPVSFRCYGRVYLIPRLTLSSG
ncbi:hypothetical protein J4731_23945 [Providencia rettgeri]|nr:hypothetical protein [Providencia rettgeri]